MKRSSACQPGSYTGPTSWRRASSTACWPVTDDGKFAPRLTPPAQSFSLWEKVAAQPTDEGPGAGEDPTQVSNRPRPQPAFVAGLIRRSEGPHPAFGHLLPEGEGFTTIAFFRLPPIMPAFQAGVAGVSTLADEKLVIIGSGPAAWTAAIYAARAELRPLVYEGAITEPNRLAGTLPLGQLNLTTEVENYPGFPAGNLAEYLDRAIAAEVRGVMAPHEGHGVSGPELMELMRQQAKNFGTRIVTDDIVKVDFRKRPFRLTPSEGEAIEAQSVIVATGARANYLGLPSEEHYKNRGVSAFARVRRRLAALSQQAAGRGRRRRFGRRGSHVPVQVRQPRLYDPSPRRPAGLKDHGRAGR